METITQIKLELIKRCMSQRTLARELGISPQLLSGVLNGTITSLPVEIKLIQWYRKLNDTRTPII
ncbi:MAG: helix-turn-helix domain-containing protein [Lentimicrobium sp.]|jgi:transcriptional regulator with XRE-family HTH domain|nr:helix-turn-helix domain-containing protein [Lentimicrobium sp.]